MKDEKDLGVIIDNELSFHKQAAAAVKKANSCLGLIKRSFIKIDKETVPLLYKSLIRPHLEYGNLIWGPFFKQDAQLVERVQRRATKLISDLSQLDYQERLKQLNLPSLQHRRRRGDMIFTYKIIRGKVNLDVKDFFVLSQNNTRGHPYKIRKQKATKRSTINCFSVRVINDWNSLPAEVVAAQTTNEFKNRLDEHWKSEMFKTPF